MHPFGFAIVLVIGVAGVVALIPDPAADPPVGPERGIPGLIALGVSAMVINWLRMTTWVDLREIRIQFGLFIPLYTKRVPVAEVLSSEVVEYRPIRQAGGWGIRWGEFEGEPTRFLNARGHRGVLIRTEKLRVIVGSADPENLVKAIELAGSA